MDYQQVHIFTMKMTLLFILIGSLSRVDSYRTDFISSMPLAGAVMARPQPPHMIQQQQGCVWSTLSNNNSGKNATAGLPPFLQQRVSRLANSFSLDCHVRTLSVDFWGNYTYNREQLESTSRLHLKCNDKLYFESVLDPSQSFFRLRNLHEVSLQSCKIRKIPTRIWAPLGFLKSLSISSYNGEWSSVVGMDIEMGAFEGLSSLEKLDLSQNNIWTIHDKNVFCPLRSLLKLNMSRNRLSDLDELGFGSSFRVGNNEDGNSGGVSAASCSNLNIQSLDLSHNSLRRINPNAFNRLKKLTALSLQNNLIDQLEDSALAGLSQLRLVNMSSNKLVALPPTIFKWNPTLGEINLSNNSISALSPQVFSGLTSLLSLDISRNTLTSQWITGNMFQGLIRLIVLKLSHNQLSYIDQNIFKDLVNLQALHLDNNRIESINPGAFQSLKNLHSLDLSSNRLALIDSRHFSNLVLLRQLYLDHNKIREMDDDSLKNCTNLNDLGLADNLLQDVPTALRVGLSHLVTLDIGENRIQTITNESFFGLGQLYGLRLVDNKLTELSLGFCEPLTKLRVLNVAQNLISKISPGAFSSCPELRALRLDTNKLEELPPTLAPQLPSLLWLNVSQNRLRWADYHILPKTIEWLDLSYNLLETLGGPVSDGGRDSVAYSLRVLDASHNSIQSLDYTTIPPTLETLRLNHNRLKQVAPDTFIRSSRLRRVELIGNLLENLPLSALRFPPVSSGKQLPEFYIGGNPFVCDCSMEWLTRVNQLEVLRQHPRIVDLDAIVCRPTFSRPNQLVPLVETRPKDFLCPYKSHCFTLCHCCDFDACDCEMSCPSNCTCYHDTAWSANIVECSNLQFSEIPSRIPMDATEIYLDGNHLPALGSHIFIGKKNLRVLYLNGSNVESIKNKTFNGLKNSLEVLLLNDNNLRELNGWEFADLENLRELYLHNNQLRFIAKETFSRLSFLQVLRIDGNLLTNFPVWELSGNGYLNSVMLANNPWSCECEYLIPYRAWVAAKSTIVVDFSLARCEPNEPLTVGSNGTIDHFYDDSSDKSGNNNGHAQLIINMCDHNKELNFNFNPNHNEHIPALLDNELLSGNHISAEKVASQHQQPSASDMDILMNNNHNNNNHNNYPSINDIASEAAAEKEVVEKESTELWTIFTSVLITLVLVLLVVLFLLFRKDHSVLFPYWMYSWFTSMSGGGSSGCCCCGTDDDDDNEGGCPNNNGHHHHHASGFISTFFHCCCGGSAAGHHGKKLRQNRGGLDDSDKLFDAYFLYSSKDEDLLLQKIVPMLESPSSSTSGYSSGTLPPPPPSHHGGASSYYRLCLHYRDLCLSAENPLNTDMVLSACDASKRIVLVISRPFLQNELSHPGFRSAIQTAISRYQNKLIFILLPPFTEQSLSTIVPELKAGHFSTISEVSSNSGGNNGNISTTSQITSLEWADKNFWSKLKLILPTPTLLSSASSPSGLNSTSTISSTGSSAIFNLAHPHHHPNLVNYNNTLSLHEYAYNTINSQHQQQQQNHYHRNILPFQQLGSGTTPPVPKHHIALSGPSWPQQQQQFHSQNFYNNSQHSQIIPIPGYPPSAAGMAHGAPPTAGMPLIVPNSYQQQQPNVPAFNESFRRHLQMQQNQHKMLAAATSAHPVNHQHHHSNCSSNSQGHLVAHPGHHHHSHHLHNHHHQGSHCSSSHSSSTSNNNPSIHPYQPLDTNYSSSSSNEELLDHVYSTLDSPPILSSNNNNNHGGCESNGELISNNKVGGSKQINGPVVEPGKVSNENSVVPQQQNRLNNNIDNCNNSSGNNANSSNSSNGTTNTNNNNGTMYFV